MIIAPQLRFLEPKSCLAFLDYSLDWTQWLAPVSDTIATVSFSITPMLNVSPYGAASPSDCTIAPTNPAISNGRVVSCWIGGGVIGRSYGVTATISTSNSTPRIDSRTVVLVVGP